MPNEIDLLLPVRPAVGLEHVVKPDREPVLAGVGLIPGIPRVDRLRLAGDQAPVDRTDVVLLEDREASFEGDRKSTRLNSSHDQISYAVFCLKKKKKKDKEGQPTVR